jgi:hypothetical protein
VKYKVVKDLSEYTLERTLNELGHDGWLLQQAFCNDNRSRFTIIMYLDDAGLNPADSVQKLKLI